MAGDPDDDDTEAIVEFRNLTVTPRQGGYLLSSVRPINAAGNKMAIVKSLKVTSSDACTFDIVLARVCVGGENSVDLQVDAVFVPTTLETQGVDEHNQKAREKFDAERRRALKKAFIDTVRQRIDAASNVRCRPSCDLREEERTLVYGKLIKRLMLDSWDLDETLANRRLSHARAEVVRSIFDVDSMLYFVAPEWWMPHRVQRQSASMTSATIEESQFQLTPSDVIGWGDVGPNAPNYRITENSAPARLGSSLGWLLQLDGDNLRKAFLNAPWVKAIIPIRPRP